MLLYCFSYNNTTAILTATLTTISTAMLTAIPTAMLTAIPIATITAIFSNGNSVETVLLLL